MANLVVTSTTNTIQVSFNDYYPDTYEFSKGTWRKDHLQTIQLNSVIHINIEGELPWLVSHNGSGGSFQIDSVNGVAPASLSDLYDKLVAMIT